MISKALVRYLKKKYCDKKIKDLTFLSKIKNQTKIYKRKKF